jgi:hypothetical protein
MSAWTSLDVNEPDEDLQMSDKSSELVHTLSSLLLYVAELFMYTQTVMSDIEEDVPLLPPLHETACELLSSVPPQFEAMVRGAEMPAELLDTLRQIKDRVEH